MFDSLTHHAYAIAGEREALVPQISSALERLLGIRARGNPDFRIEFHDVMGIDESRSLKEAAGRRAITGGRKIFVISARGVTKEAQNALLKLFEEPAPETHFFLIVPTLELLLPTLLSRLFVLRIGTERVGMVSERVREFLSAATPARLKTVQALVKSANEENGKKKLIAFMDDVERGLASGGTNAQRKSLEEVFRVKRYAHDRAPSFKLLFEHLALVLPKVE
ncbi:MAG: hypothetical protein A2W52_04900 [Candidatus Taylorbacteria bacterium RIFCSPHIGHO2_02_49_25]|uniref:DNA polymerase III subunit delta n=1 Tax=Candidatus Taylorbacteria bacterium RIFCSPHIGHO2_02_49_25 TaxID=1802305 RepID=A0A1G2MH65_9BACT|nr:MAG: polymerase III subunit delta' protein [Parcubacteria group bacterium GW2011_GWF2_50_9]OHA21728.1 MAG: hypothetical protein A2759_02350 [Candidatus Taylorbacteria bacterium RIFCSPHIGHO2_01_FULL_49_60]OHA22381.1 MAG: hypothetical protein A2W52_04900 [Candidatus Taylorbacteria bacterium RIFCSPHIGHO2_02_49_25]OHA35180.1 MAG: hypothetical protein A3B27_01305 [Candidatus Taylorbacteria bacterium RIFCSPLOWO2_01_FULL_50_130]OHA35861.1 MAG: hypothetical protein A2W65_03660 [Candidatus Taylorbact